MLWFSSYVIVFEFSWNVKEKKIGGITYWLTLVLFTIENLFDGDDDNNNNESLVSIFLQASVMRL